MGWNGTELGWGSSSHWASARNCGEGRPAGARSWAWCGGGVAGAGPRGATGQRGGWTRRALARSRAKRQQAGARCSGLGVAALARTNAHRIDGGCSKVQGKGGDNEGNVYVMIPPEPFRRGPPLNRTALLRLKSTKKKRRETPSSIVFEGHRTVLCLAMKRLQNSRHTISPQKHCHQSLKHLRDKYALTISPFLVDWWQYRICTKGYKVRQRQTHHLKSIDGLPLDVCFLEKCFGLHGTHTRINTPPIFYRQGISWKSKANTRQDSKYEHNK